MCILTPKLQLIDDNKSEPDSESLLRCNGVYISQVGTTLERSQCVNQNFENRACVQDRSNQNGTDQNTYE